jgi:hypothetical protein
MTQQGQLRMSFDNQSRFKLWMVRFKGVASKYLPSYLGWRRMIERDGTALTSRHCLASAMG